MRGWVVMGYPSDDFVTDPCVAAGDEDDCPKYSNDDET